jgi:putative ABC transport system ATP-binding protein
VSTPPSGPLLSIEEVRKEYPGTPPLEVLHGISFSIAQGELLAIVGPSGSGKSTLLQIMGTLDRPTSGRMLLDGVDVTSLDDQELSRFRATRVGFVFQQFFLLDGRSAVENVADGLLYAGVRHAERKRRAVEILEMVGLGHRLDHYPNKLSGGERQRVAIARAIVHRPSIVLADEPTGNLDTRNGKEVLGLIRALNEMGTTIVVITHDRELASELPRSIEIRDGVVGSDTRPKSPDPSDQSPRLTVPVAV